MNPEVDWPAVREAVELGDESRGAICRRHRISRGELERRIRINKWNAEPRNDEGDRRIIIDRLFGVLERQIERMGEIDMTTDGTKEAQTLGKLVSTLETLIAIDARGTGKPPSARQSKEMAELRTRIAARLDELKVD